MSSLRFVRLLPLLALIGLVGCQDATSTAQSGPQTKTAPAADTTSKATIRQVDVQGLKQALDQGKVPLLLDVRTPGEFQGGHVPGAINIAVGDLAGRLAEVKSYKTGDVYVICRSGRRSMTASQVLLDGGYKPINVEGGTLAWIAKGLAVE